MVPGVLEISKVHIEFVESAPCCELLFHFFLKKFFAVVAHLAVLSWYRHHTNLDQFDPDTIDNSAGY